MRFNCSYEQSGVTAGTNIASWTEILRQIWHIVIVYDLIPRHILCFSYCCYPRLEAKIRDRVLTGLARTRSTLLMRGDSSNRTFLNENKDYKFKVF